MEASTQMNVRISAELKERGDAALADIGLNPSQAVRALWHKAAKRGEDLEELARVLSDGGNRAPSAQRNPVEDGWRMMDAALTSLGLDTNAPLAASDDELLEEYWRDRELQRSLA